MSDSRRFREWMSSLTLCAVLGAAPLLPAVASASDLPSFERIRVLETARAIDDAQLSDQEGRAFKLTALKGKVTFVLFGFTNCPDVCPVDMERMRELHDSGSVDNGKVAYVMISVDGERDTPPVMKTFIEKYSKDFIGLTAEPKLINPIASQFSATFFKGAHNGHDGGYNVTHSSQIFVLDQAGQLRAEVYGASIEAMAGVANALLAEAN